MAKLDEALVMRTEQRRQFERLLLEETLPPAQFGPYDRQVVMLQAAQLPEEKWKPLLDDRQWKNLTRQFQKAHDLEPFLKSSGLLPGANSGAAGSTRAVSPCRRSKILPQP